jgi:hypothetical protein
MQPDKSHFPAGDVAGGASAPGVGGCGRFVDPLAGGRRWFIGGVVRSIGAGRPSRRHRAHGGRRTVDDPRRRLRAGRAADADSGTRMERSAWRWI